MAPIAMQIAHTQLAKAVEARLKTIRESMKSDEEFKKRMIAHDFGDRVVYLLDGRPIFESYWIVEGTQISYGIRMAKLEK